MCIRLTYGRKPRLDHQARAQRPGQPAPSGETLLAATRTAEHALLAVAATLRADLHASAEVAPTPTPEALLAGTRPEDRDINISLTEWKLQPSRTRVPAGLIRFLAENSGSTQHALRIVGQGMDVSTDDFSYGDSRIISRVLPPGEYQLVCPIPGHELQGMTATLTVVGQ